MTAIVAVGAPLAHPAEAPEHRAVTPVVRLEARSRSHRAAAELTDLVGMVTHLGTTDLVGMVTHRGTTDPVGMVTHRGTTDPAGMVTRPGTTGRGATTRRALRELRTYRRLSGSNEQLPLMVDCERGLGRPDKGLELARSVDRATLSVPTRVELAIAMSGARLDLGQTEQALTELEIPQLDPSTAYSYSPALFDAYAVVLADLGRPEEADTWARRADVAAEAISRAEGDVMDIMDVVEETLVDGGVDSSRPPVAE